MSKLDEIFTLVDGNLETITDAKQQIKDLFFTIINNSVHPRTGEMHRYLDEDELRKAVHEL